MATTVSTPSGDKLTSRRRPSPRIAQMRRTWYFFSRNTLALVGLGILVFFVFVALYSFFAPGSPTQLDLYCGTYNGVGEPSSSSVNLTGACHQVCTYPSNQPPPSPNCYPVDQYNPGFVAPTLNLAHGTGGPLPLGSLSVNNGAYFFSIYQGELKGAPWSLGISAGIVGAGALIGLLLGSVAGFLGGYTDEIIMRITDIFLSIPGILLVLVLLAVLGGTITTLNGRVAVLMGAFIVTWWPIYTRIVRGQVLVTREQKYVEASRASGARSGRILRHHIIPNSLFPIFVQMSLDVGSIPILLGALVYLGFHIFPSTYFPEWGSVSANAILLIPSQMSTCFIYLALNIPCSFPWWQLVFPGVTIFLFAISVNFLSDGLRDSLDPRLRR
jgi:peptide/nickel transport system permease protein